MVPGYPIDYCQGYTRYRCVRWREHRLHIVQSCPRDCCLLWRRGVGGTHDLLGLQALASKVAVETVRVMGVRVYIILYLRT